MGENLQAWIHREDSFEIKLTTRGEVSSSKIHNGLNELLGAIQQAKGSQAGRLQVDRQNLAKINRRRECTELLAAINQLEERDYRYDLYMDARFHGVSHGYALRKVVDTPVADLFQLRRSITLA